MARWLNWINIVPWEITAEKSTTVMVAAFSIQAGLVSLYLSPAHPKPAETTCVSISKTHFASEQLILSLKSSWKLCSSTLLLFLSCLYNFFFFPWAELTSDLKWTLSRALSHFLINSNQHDGNPDRSCSQTLLLGTAPALAPAASQLFSAERKCKAASRTQI